MHQKHGAPGRALTPFFTRVASLALIAAAAAMAPPASAAMKAAVGIYRCTNGYFYFDGNYDAKADLKVQFPAPPAAPIPCPPTVRDIVGLAADVSGSGLRSPATYNAGLWSLDRARDGTADTTFGFGGVAGDVPLFADMNGTGQDVPVIYRNGAWYVSSMATPGVVTATYYFGGAPGDIPLLADVDGDGKVDLIIYRIGVYGGTWYVSTKRDGVADKVFFFGGVAGDVPLAFDYDGDGIADIVIYRAGRWYVSTQRNGVADAIVYFGGQPNDRPLYLGRGAISDPALDAARFLQQASFGPTPAEIANVASMTYAGWINDQLTKPVTALPAFAWQPDQQPANCTSPLTPGGPADPYGTDCPNDVYGMKQVQRFFYLNAFTAPDQLRQRVAWALSQIMVTSSLQDSIAYANRDYQQLLIDHAFDNFRNLLYYITVSPFMGNYLDMVNNAKATANTQPNENYAREIMQLFSIGTLELNNDGSLLLDISGNPIQTYDQTDISELAKVMTGWTYYPLPTKTLAWPDPINYAATMYPCEGPTGSPPCGATNFHETSIKTVLGYTIPPGLTAATDLATALDVIFYHPNVGPFISKQLIQHLVTSNPSPAFVNRVANVFNNNGSGVRGDMGAVVKAILLDPEARAPRNPIGTFGKLKEPVVLITNFLRQMGNCCGAYSDGIDPATRSRAMSQDVYTSPTVFNYYPADYVIPGTPLAGPQFGIYDPTALFESTKTIYNWTLGAGCAAAPGNTNLCGPNADAKTVGAIGTKIDWTPLANAAKYANNVPALVDDVTNILFCSNLCPLPVVRLPAGLRQQVINGVNGVPVNNPPTSAQLRDRARTAVYLIATSPKYQVEY